MRAFRTFVVVSTLVGSLTAAPAALAAGQAPAGNGVFSLTSQDDIAITDLVCDDDTITQMNVARGGLAGWVVGEPDRMYVLTSISGEGTATTPDGSESYTFAQSYGRKAGLTEVTVCTMDYAIAYGEVTDTGRMEVTLVRVW